MTIPPLSLGIIKGAEWLKALHAEMFTYGQAHGHMNKSAEHTSVHALAGRLQAGPNGNLELTVPSSLIKGVFDALDEPGAEFVVRNSRTECAIKVMTKEEVDKLGGVSHISERGHSYHYTLGPIVELPATGDYDKLWAISIKSNDLEDIRKSYGLETSPQLGFYIPVGCKKKRVTEDNAVSKLAGVYTASGEKVQGVGLRKMYHSLLEEQGLPGLGVNNEDTGDVELSFDGDEAKRQEVFNQLGSRVQAKTGHPVTFAPVDIPQSSVPVSLSNKDTERLNAIHHLAYRMSNMYDPADPLLDSNDNFKQKLADRFRLQVNQRGLKGTVPSRAAEQLLGTRPMYEGMMPARRTRSEEEALSDMAEEQKRRLLKALRGGRGFLAPNESGISKLASLLKNAGETFKYSDKVGVDPEPKREVPAPAPVRKIIEDLGDAAMKTNKSAGITEGEDTPSTIKPAEPLPANKLPSMQPDPDPAPLKNPRNRRPVDMPLYTFPSGSKQVGHIKQPDAMFTKNPSEDWESGAGYSKGQLESPGASSGSGVLRFSSHGGGEPGRYGLSNPGNHPIYLDDKSYGMPKFMQGQNPSTVISSACNLEGGCDPSVYARAFAGANPGNKPNLKNVAMVPPGKLGLGTAPLFKGYDPELGSIGAPYFASLVGKLKGGAPLNDYSLREGGDPTNKDDWKNNGIYTKGRQSMPLFGLPGEAIEAGTHFYRGGNFKQLLDNTEAINTNPDATEMQKFYSTNARLGSSAAVAATRSIPEIISSISENNHLRAMQDRSQRKLSKTPAVQTPGLYPGVPIN